MSDASSNNNIKKNEAHNLESKESFENNLKNVLEMKFRSKEINKVSKSFCTAKWLQSTVYLHTGFTHSCHHPDSHKIPLQEIEQDPSALHNTSFKKLQRHKMLEGERPSECQYCWNIEDLPGGHTSDRIYKSTNLEWSYPHLKTIQEHGSIKNINPTYLEIAFDNTCNFKCMYCSPDISTTWMDEVIKFGPYPTSQNTGNLDWLRQSDKMPIRHDEKNPYVDAFWKWWPTLYTDLNTFRVTGGEPLLNQNTWLVLKHIEENPRGEFNLAINSNMGVQKKWIDKLISVANKIKDNIASLDIYTSCEAKGECAEYIRFGLKYGDFMANINNFLSNGFGQNRIHFMITFNALSVTSFVDFLNDIKDLRKKYKPFKKLDRTSLMISYLHWPKFQSVQILPKDIKQSYAAQYLNYIEEHSIESGPNGFLYLEEVEQIKRLIDFMLIDIDDDELQTRMKDFGSFYKEYDQRKNLSFTKIFPELKHFYETCLNL